MNSVDTQSHYDSGYTDGYTKGYLDGEAAGYNTGYTAGRSSVDCSTSDDEGWWDGRASCDGIIIR